MLNLILLTFSNCYFLSFVDLFIWWVNEKLIQDLLNVIISPSIIFLLLLHFPGTQMTLQNHDTWYVWLFIVGFLLCHLRTFSNFNEKSTLELQEHYHIELCQFRMTLEEDVSGVLKFWSIFKVNIGVRKNALTHDLCRFESHS